MKSRSLVVLALTTALAAGGFAVVAASAQQPPAPPAEGAGAPPPPPPHPGRFGHGWNHGSEGFGMFGMGRGMGGPHMRLSAADRAALLDAKMAEIKTGLTLTPDQQKLWQPVETAIRDGVKEGEGLRKEFAGKDRPTNMIDRLERMAKISKTRGDIMQKIADAARPLYASLNPDQKRRLAILMHRPGEGGGWGRERGEGRGWGHGPGPMRGRMHGGVRPFHDFGDDHAQPERQGALQPQAPNLYRPALDLLSRDPFAAAIAHRAENRGL